MFFTVDNAQQIDFARDAIEALRPQLSEDEYKFLIASLVLAADAVSNVPAVYGCYLKNFKDKAKKSLILKPIHTLTVAANPDSKTSNRNVLDIVIRADAVYLDPPYNERQYSKNYFPLNVICESEGFTIKGKTGIPDNCFLSSFCKKSQVEDAFKQLFANIKAEWVFLSYSSESIVPKNRMIEILQEYGNVTIEEKEDHHYSTGRFPRFRAIDFAILDSWVDGKLKLY
jgi:adenine-specific DNA-methyltransferase